MTIYLNHCQVAWYFQTKPGCLFDYPTVPERQPCLKKNLPHHPLDAHSSEQFLPHKMTQVPQTGQSILQTHCWGYPSHLGMGQKFSKLKMPKKKHMNKQPITTSYHQLSPATITYHHWHNHSVTSFDPFCRLWVSQATGTLQPRPQLSLHIAAQWLWCCCPRQPTGRRSRSRPPSLLWPSSSPAES